MMTIAIATLPNNLSQDSSFHEVVPLLTPQWQVMEEICAGGISGHTTIVHRQDSTPAILGKHKPQHKFL